MSSSASLMSGCKPRSSKLGGFGSAGAVGISASDPAAVSDASEAGAESAALIAASAASVSVVWSPFADSVSFVIGQNLGVVVLSEIVQSERWPGRQSLEIHRHGTTSFVAAPAVVTDAELARKTFVV